MRAIKNSRWRVLFSETDYLSNADKVYILQLKQKTSLLLFEKDLPSLS